MENVSDFRKKGLFLVPKSHCFYMNRGSLEPQNSRKGVLFLTRER